MAAASSGVAGRTETSPMSAPPCPQSARLGAIREIDCSHADDEKYFWIMELNPAHVRTLREIARHGSFSRAAESLRLSQPAVSLHMRQLEARCGTALLERMG
ncbi:MAG: helix-turn-helix domain-containing protein, partial [Candidatus Rokuibacteriota bacterium]